MSANEAVVAAVQQKLGCWRGPDEIDPQALGDVCRECSNADDGWRVPWDERGCRMAVGVADAAIEALWPFARIVEHDRIVEYAETDPEVWVDYEDDEEGA